MKKLALLVALMPAVAVARPVRNAYLDYRVTSVAGLVAEVKKDHAVADRYMRHFGMSKEDLVAMFRGLHVAKMTEEKSVLMFGVPDDGIIHSHPTVLRKGLLVFADLEGEPILKMECGNPVVVHIKPDLDGPGMVVGSLISPPPDVVSETTPPPPDEIETLLQNPNTPLDETSTLMAVTSQPLSEPSVIIPPILAAAGPPGWLVGIPLLFIPFTPHHSPPPTPEPITTTAFAIGAGALAWSKRRRSRV